MPSGNLQALIKQPHSALYYLSLFLFLSSALPLFLSFVSLPVLFPYHHLPSLSLSLTLISLSLSSLHTISHSLPYIVSLFLSVISPSHYLSILLHLFLFSTLYLSPFSCISASHLLPSLSTVLSVPFACSLFLSYSLTPIPPSLFPCTSTFLSHPSISLSASLTGSPLFVSLSLDVPRAANHKRGRGQPANQDRELVQAGEEGVPGTRPHCGALQMPR